MRACARCGGPMPERRKADGYARHAARSYCSRSCARRGYAEHGARVVPPPACAYCGVGVVGDGRSAQDAIHHRSCRERALYELAVEAARGWDALPGGRQPPRHARAMRRVLLERRLASLEPRT